jgi:hypothetical protein
MVLLEFVFQVVQIVYLVSLRGANIFMAGHVLNLAKIVSAKPVSDHAAADLFCTRYLIIQLLQLKEHISYPVIDILS